MIITVACPWFDEAPEDLDRYVRALPVAADRLVAVDGGYARYPGATARSAKAEEAAIREAAKDIGLPADIRIPDRVWRGQLEKRSYMMAAAAEGSDWVLTLDADHILHGVREAIRHEIEGVVDEDGVEVDFYTTPNYERPIEETAATDWHSFHSGGTQKIRLFLRAMPGMRVERYHWWNSGLKDGERVWLYGGDKKSYPSVKVHTLSAPFLVEHRCLYRRTRNILAGREFAADRVAIVEATKQEDDLEMVFA